MSSKSSQSPRAGRASTEDALKYAKGEVQFDAIRPLRKDGGPENSGIKDPDGGGIEKVNSRASKPRRSS